MHQHPKHLAICFLVVMAAGSWGLYWLPQRALASAGLTGGWGTIAQYIVPLILLSPVMVWRTLRGQSAGAGLPLLGILMGGGIVCYANSFLMTDVVRTLFLFYLTPVWATLFELAFLGVRPGWRRGVNIALALAGVWLVFGQNGGVPIPSNQGDWLAFFGGMLFAGGAVRAQAVQPEGVFPLLFSFFLYGGLVAVLQSALFVEALGDMPGWRTWIEMLPWLVLLSVVFFIPTIGLIIWSPSRIGAGLFGILILAELVFGTASAALLTDERFGWREAAGCALIVGAAVAEIMLARRPVEQHA